MGVVSEVETTFTETAVPSKKLRLKILSKKPANESCELSQVGEKDLKSTLGTEHVIRRCQFSTQVPKVNSFVKSSLTQNQLTNAIGNRKVNSIVGCKRSSEEILESHEGKRLKMDRMATLQCQSILTKLMSHKKSSLFHEPVNPVAWGIHDYFDIIKRPMDLGTIKQKLLQKTYIDAEKFAADVRLTFSNAMLYNPPGNWVHEYAKELTGFFDKLWKPFERKMDREDKDTKQRGPETSYDKIMYDVKGKCLSKISSHIDQLPGKAIMQKENGSEELKKLIVEGQYSDHKAVEDEKPRHKLSSKNHSDTSGCISCLHKERACPTPAKVKCENKPGKKVAHDDSNVVKVKNTSTLQMDTYGQDSDGNLSFMHKEADGASVSATTGSLGTTGKGLNSDLDVELSPSKALRVARLKSRFADTILKAQQNSLLEPGVGTEATIWQQEKEMLRRRQQEEKARLEAQIRAAESAAQLKAELELKKQRQEAREAARMAIKKMERSVDVNDNLQVLKDLEAMIGSSLVVVCSNNLSRANVWSRVEIDKLRSPLEQLGLYIKEEYMVGNDDDYAFSEEEDQEEGEFIC